jgi:predicted permease
MFKLEGRKMIFQGGGSYNNIRSLILKEKISDKVLEVFVLFLLILNIIIIILFMFLCFTGR